MLDSNNPTRKVIERIMDDFTSGRKTPTKTAQSLYHLGIVVEVALGEDKAGKTWYDAFDSDSQLILRTEIE